MLQQGFRRSSAQNRGLGGDVRLKSGEPTAVPTAAAAVVGVQKQNTQKSPAEPRVHDLRSPNLPTEQRYMTMHSYVWNMCGDRAPSGLVPRIADTKIVF